MIFKLTTDGKAITQMAKDWAKRAGILEKDQHIVACSIVAHAVKHGDATKADMLPNLISDAMSDAWRKSAMYQWFEAYGPFTYVAKDGDKPAHFKIDKDKRAKLAKQLEKLGEADFLAKLGESKTFWEFKPAKPYMPEAFRNELARIIKKFEGYEQNEDRKAKVQDNFDGIDKAKKLLADLGGKVEMPKAA